MFEVHLAYYVLMQHIDSHVLAACCTDAVC